MQNLKANLSEESQDNLIINLRADRNTDMGIVNDLKKELRDVGALTIRYSATEKSPSTSK